MPPRSAQKRRPPPPPRSSQKPSNPPETARNGAAMEDARSQANYKGLVVEEKGEDFLDEEEEEDLEEDPEEDPEEELVEEEEEGEEEGEGMEEGEGEEEEEAVEVPEPIREKRKKREFEVFVGGLPRDAIEEDLEKVFKNVGQVVEVRLARIPFSNKNKGFGFVRFATVEQARAAAELKHVKVQGKSCGVIKSNDNETLHVAGICTSWTKDDLLETLKAFELENLEEVNLIEDPYNKGKNRGYAFLDFSTHMDAVAACSKLQKGSIFFGTDVRAEISFSKTIEPDEEVMAQVKAVFLDGLPATWNEAKVQEQFKKFGEIESVQLARNMPTAKRKDFGFICFTTRQAALDCIEKVNRYGVGEGAEKVLVKATLKRPLQKRGPPVLGVRRGYIGKGFSRRVPQSYGFAYSFPSRPARSREYMGRGFSDRSRGLSRLSSRGVGFKPSVSSPSGKYVARLRRGSAREIPGMAVVKSRSREPYLESSSSGRYTTGSHRYFASTKYRLRALSPDADVYAPQFERHKAYEYPVRPGYKNLNSEQDYDMVASSSLTRCGRSRSSLEMSAYPQRGPTAYDEQYSGRVFREDPSVYDSVEYASRKYGSRDDSVEYASREYESRYDSVEYASREYGSRYLSGRGASKSYY